MRFNKNPESYFNNTVNRSRYSSYVKGEGVEIGALAWPLSLPAGARCRYVDIHPTEKLKGIYKEYEGLIVAVDIVDDGQFLVSLSDNSQDFIIANHFLEHAVNVVRTLWRWYDVLKGSGILFLSIPDWRFTADQVRQRTPIQHLFDEFEQNVSEIPEDHCIDNLVAWNGIPRDRIDASMITQCRRDGVHNHCWECEDILQLFQVLFEDKGKRFQLLDLSLPQGLYNEFILILQKSPQASNFWTKSAREKYQQQKDIEIRNLSSLKDGENKGLVNLVSS